MAMIAKQNPTRIKEIMDKFPIPADLTETLVVPKIEHPYFREEVEGIFRKAIFSKKTDTTTTTEDISPTIEEAERPLGIRIRSSTTTTTPTTTTATMPTRATSLEFT